VKIEESRGLKQGRKPDLGIEPQSGEGLLICEQNPSGVRIQLEGVGFFPGNQTFPCQQLLLFLFNAKRGTGQRISVDQVDKV